MGCSSRIESRSFQSSAWDPAVAASLSSNASRPLHIPGPASYTRFPHKRFLFFNGYVNTSSTPYCSAIHAHATRIPRRQFPQLFQSRKQDIDENSSKECQVSTSSSQAGATNTIWIQGLKNTGNLGYGHTGLRFRDQDLHRKQLLYLELSKAIFLGRIRQQVTQATTRSSFR